MSALPPDYVLIDDQSLIDPKATHAYLTRSYWAANIPLATVRKSIANSFCVAVQFQGAQVGFARVVTDYATFAYLADVYVLEGHNGRGLAHVMLAHLQAHPDLQGLRRWALFTKDAQSLYAQFGWKQYPMPDRMMTRDDPDVYA